nr:hypothetical protein [Tanacetum cinerariifolium]
MITQPTDVPSGNNTEVSGSITRPLVPDVANSHTSNQSFTSSHLIPQDRWSRDQHIELVNITGNLGKGMLTRRNNTEVSGSITRPLVPNVANSHTSNQSFTSSHLIPQDRWSRDQHIELVNITGNLGKGMLTRRSGGSSMSSMRGTLGSFGTITSWT